MKRELPKRIKIYQSPMRLLVFIALTIFFTHTFAMVLFSVLPHFAVWVESLVESTLLLLLLFPVLYFFSFRPLILHIAEREQAEIAMWESEFKYRNVIENSSDAVFLVDVESGCILDTNKQGEHLLGRTRGEIMGMNQSKLYPPETQQYELERFSAYSQQDQLGDYAVEISRKDGSNISACISGVPTFVHGRKLILEFVRDMTGSGTQRQSNSTVPSNS